MRFYKRKLLTYKTLHYFVLNKVERKSIKLFEVEGDEGQCLELIDLRTNGDAIAMRTKVFDVTACIISVLLQ